MPPTVGKIIFGGETSVDRVKVRPVASSPTTPSDPPPPKKARYLSPKFLALSQDPVVRAENARKATEANRASVRSLTFKQKRFVAELLADPARNVLQAMIRAGYSENSAYTSGTDLRNHPQVVAAIEEADRKLFTKYEITHDRVVKEVAAIAFSSILDYLSEDPDNPGTYRIDLSNVTRDQAGAIKDYTVSKQGLATVERITMNDKLAALTLLGKHFGMFQDKQPDVTKQSLTISALDAIISGNLVVNNLQVGGGA